MASREESMASRETAEEPRPPFRGMRPACRKALSALRVGTGYDVHAFAPGRALIVGGVEIPYERDGEAWGLDGHSDADVLVHAIMDALLGAAHLDDIGALFPDNDPAYEGADSIALLREVDARLTAAGWAIVNIDAVIIAQAPRMTPHRPAMVARIAEAAGIEEECVGVKATTTEHLGFTGRGEGIAAQATCLICRCS